MGFELDKHDLFRNVIPGSVFLLVIFFFDINCNLPNIELFLAITITLPIGYIIHNIYRALHVISGELKNWERYESDLIEEILKDTAKNSIKTTKSKKEKELSWLVESCLHIKSSKEIRERGYNLISRIHSLGSSALAVLIALVFIYFKSSFCQPVLPSLIIWFSIIFCFIKARTTAIEGYQALIKHFVTIRRKFIIAIAEGKVDPFGEEEE